MIIKRLIKPVIWLAGIFPLCNLLWLFYSGGLGANPIEFINRTLGEFAIIFLCFTLAVTPLRLLTNWVPIVRVRRLLGLFSFFYVCLHFSFYIGVEQFFHWPEIWKDILKRNFITAGFFAFLILVPLALTSTKLMIKRLGGKTWKKIHKGTYLAASLACLHFVMMRKGFQMEPFYYFGFLILMFAIRIIYKFKKSINVHHPN